MTGISKSAVYVGLTDFRVILTKSVTRTRRYTKVMKSIDSGQAGPTTPPKRKMGANKKGDEEEPAPKKRKGKVTAGTDVGEEAKLAAGGDGNSEERV